MMFFFSHFLSSSFTTTVTMKVVASIDHFVLSGVPHGRLITLLVNILVISYIVNYEVVYNKCIIL